MQKEKLIQLLNHKKPIRYSKNSEVYEIENLIVKVFKYKNLFEQIFSLKGLRSYLISKILLKKNINAPKIIIYYFKKNFEIIVYKKIEGEEFIKKIKKVKDSKEFYKLIEKLKAFTKELFEKNVYHKDYDLTNIIIDKKGNLYLIDIENISFLFSKNSEKRMLKKINRILKIDLNCSVDIF